MQRRSLAPEGHPDITCNACAWLTQTRHAFRVGVGAAGCATADGWARAARRGCCDFLGQLGRRLQQIKRQAPGARPSRAADANTRLRVFGFSCAAARWRRPRGLWPRHSPAPLLPPPGSGFAASALVLAGPEPPRATPHVSPYDVLASPWAQAGGGILARWPCTAAFAG